MSMDGILMVVVRDGGGGGVGMGDYWRRGWMDMLLVLVLVMGYRNIVVDYCISCGMWWR